jgi:hypothetical protein
MTPLPKGAPLSLAELRKHLGAARPANDAASAAALPTGNPRLDALLGGGWPRGRIVEVAGPWSSGKTSLLFRSLAEVTRRRQLAAWIDGRGELYPPSAATLGVDLDRLLVVRPSRGGTARAGEIVARSAAFPLVVLDLADGERLEDAAIARLRAAAAAGGAVVAALAPRPGAVAQAAVKLELDGGEPLLSKGGSPGGIGAPSDRRFHRGATDLPRIDLVPPRRR